MVIMRPICPQNQVQSAIHTLTTWCHCKPIAMQDLFLHDNLRPIVQKLSDWISNNGLYQILKTGC